MSDMIFVNLPASDLDRSTRFYEKIGFTKNEAFSDDTASGMAWSDTIHAMLLTHEKWRGFTDRTIPDAHSSAQVLICLSRPNREAVDDMVEAARDAGGTPDPNPLQDHGFMYGRSLADPDGHIWEVMWMDAEAMSRGAQSIEQAEKEQ